MDFQVTRPSIAVCRSHFSWCFEFNPQHLAINAKYGGDPPYFLHILWILAIFGVTFGVSVGRIVEG
ncbi:MULTISPECIES: hypothetical protein [unclassified Ruegeria]|uniref:hypothetical protein n=1 Tax=unclassified Ruegeria TaxID=2625375 RepID=UPI00148863F0|nr:MULTISPECIES: hypothetical protein [unclassified Ruegeria]